MISVFITLSLMIMSNEATILPLFIQDARGGSKQELGISENANIGDLRRSIAHQTSGFKHDPELVLHAFGAELRDDERSLREAGIVAQSVIQFSWRTISIKVQPWDLFETFADSTIGSEFFSSKIDCNIVVGRNRFFEDIVGCIRSTHNLIPERYRAALNDNQLLINVKSTQLGGDDGRPVPAKLKLKQNTEVTLLLSTLVPAGSAEGKGSPISRVPDTIGGVRGWWSLDRSSNLHKVTDHQAWTNAFVSSYYLYRSDRDTAAAIKVWINMYSYDLWFIVEYEKLNELQLYLLNPSKLI
eukprot:177390_1